MSFAVNANFDAVKKHLPYVTTGTLASATAAPLLALLCGVNLDNYPIWQSYRWVREPGGWPGSISYVTETASIAPAGALLFAGLSPFLFKITAELYRQAHLISRPALSVRTVKRSS